MPSGRDTGIAAGLFVGTVAYLWFWPRELNGFDESLYLYEAKRILDGAVMYRDMFDLITPAWFYGMAALFALFGVGIETARAAMSVTHGLIGVLIFALCRLVGVRPIIAVVLGMTHIVLGYPACPIATPHWGSTLLALVLLLVVLQWPATTVARAFLWGAIGGLLTLVQQQKGTLMVIGAGVILLFDAILNRDRVDHVRASRRVIGYVIGVAVVVAPVLLAFIWAAGFDEVFRALVRYPLVNYRQVHNAPWGIYFPGLLPHAYIIANLPLVIPAAALWLIWQWRMPADAKVLRDGTILFIYSVFALWSVYYLPDHLHFSYVAPVWWVLLGCMTETMLRTRPAVMPVRVAASILIVAGCWQLLATMQQWRGRCPYQIQTAFGQIDTQNPEAGAVYQWFNDLFRAAGATHIFSFPTNAAMYLITGTENATRYQIVLPNYTDREQFQEIVDDLERQKTEFVVRNFFLAPRRMEPLNAYLEQNYTSLPLPSPFKTTNIIHVYQRKKDAGSTAPAVF